MQLKISVNYFSWRIIMEQKLLRIQIRRLKKKFRLYTPTIWQDFSKDLKSEWILQEIIVKSKVMSQVEL